MIEFGCHCFTKSPHSHRGETLNDFPSGLHYALPKETRIFCFERYRYSKLLPQIVRGLAQRKCFFTAADDRFLTVAVETEDGRTVDYEIYFSLRKSKNKDCDVYVYINSAYIRDESYKQRPPQRYKPVSFFVLLYNTLHNKKIKRPQ